MTILFTLFLLVQVGFPAFPTPTSVVFVDADSNLHIGIEVFWPAPMPGPTIVKMPVMNVPTFTKVHFKPMSLAFRPGTWAFGDILIVISACGTPVFRHNMKADYYAKTVSIAAHTKNLKNPCSQMDIEIHWAGNGHNANFEIQGMGELE